MEDASVKDLVTTSAEPSPSGGVREEDPAKREERLERCREYSRRFYATSYGRQTKRKYLKTAKGKAVHRESMARYRATKPESVTRYENSDARKAAKAAWAREYRARKKAEAATKVQAAD